MILKAISELGGGGGEGGLVIVCRIMFLMNDVICKPPIVCIQNLTD